MSTQGGGIQSVGINLDKKKDNTNIVHILNATLTHEGSHLKVMKVV